MARPTTDLAEWLARHGLDQYAQTFAENNIEYSVLPDLTEDDLEKLGVSLGHRKKLLRAIDTVRPASKRATQPKFRASARRQSLLCNIATLNFVRSQ